MFVLLDGKLAPKIYHRQHIPLITHYNTSHTGGRSSMILHSLSLPVERVVLRSLEGVLGGAGESTLERGADGWGTELRSAAGELALRKHCVLVWL